MTVPDPLFAPPRPRCARRIAVGGGHLLYIEECGPEDGLPVLFLHGGPGSGCSEAQRRLFDPRRYRAIFVDQRGSGRSLPLGGLDANTTPDLIADFEQIREALGIPAWVLFGGSWGSLLALAYAQIFPERVLGLVLRGIFLGSREEIRAYLGGRPITGPARAILCGSEEEARDATWAWLDHERRLMGEPPLAAPPDAGQQAKVRIQMHYLARDCFIRPGELLAGIDRLRHLPGAIVQGTADPVCPPAAAEQLRRAWPEAIWMPVPGAGHGLLTPPIARACIKALDWVAECGVSA